MYKRILVPLDGSRSAESVLHHVRSIADAHKTEIVLLHVVPSTGTDALPTGSSTTDVTASAWDKAGCAIEAYLESVARSLGASGLKGRVVLRKGIVSAAILDVAESIEADLIVLAAYGQTGPRAQPLGSVTYAVVQHVRCPVLLIWPRAPVAPSRLLSREPSPLALSQPAALFCNTLEPATAS
jgi:nucleotide-binding universal stress UspA family protein